MIVHRHWIALLIAGGLCGAPAVLAQEDAGGGGATSGSSGAGASSSFGSGDTSSGGGSSIFDTAPSGSSSPFGSLFDSGDTPSTSTAAPNIFGSNPTGTAPPASGTPGAASTFGTGASLGSPAVPAEPAPSFTLPGAYGQAAQTFTLGVGRLARPRFELSFSLMTGYDDNTLQTPTGGIPEVRGLELVDPGEPARIVEEPVYGPLRPRLLPNGRVIFVREVVGSTQRVIPGREPEYREVVISPGQERVGSFFTRASANFEMTVSSRRTVFTMDLRGNADYYFSRPNDQIDLTGSVAFNFLHRITPRLQFSASASLAYLSQPDVRLINGPSRNVGDYFVATSKFDLSYRWTRRISTITSFSFNSLLYSEPMQQIGDYYEGILGTEGRYAWSRRLTLLGEVRYGQIVYPENALLDSQTLYLLIGGEYALTKRISTSLRLGESFRTFDTGGSTATPYLEATGSWRYSPRGFLSLNSRFGFEESGSAEAETLAFRTGLSAVHAFSSRLRGSAGLTYVHRTTTFEASDLDFTEQTFDVNVGLEYALSKRMSLNASYVFTTTISDSEVNDYYRNRIFLGMQYNF